MTVNYRAIRLAAGTAMVAGTAVLTASPSYAGPAPEDPTPTVSSGGVEHAGDQGPGRA
jgi:hypothetical protein